MPNKRNIIIKISGELFKSKENPIDQEKIFGIAKEIKKIFKNYNIGLVIGAGNIFRGRNIDGLDLNMTTAHFIGMTSTLVNALAIKNIFDAIDIPSRIISALSFPQVIGVSNHFDIDKYFELGEILIFAGGTGNPFASTDTCAVIRALEIKAEFILKATKVKGVYDCDPRKNPGAIKFKNLNYETFLQLKESFVLDRTAIVLAAENNIPIYIFKWEQGALKKAVKLKAGGTLIK